MAHALPIAKLAGLLVKSLAKPVSKRIKHEFSRYAVTQRLLHAIGQTSHQVTSRMTIWSAGYKVRSIPDLPEDKAVQIGSEFVGESFILVVSAATVLFEYNRSKEKEELKAEQKRAEAAAEQHALQLKLHALDVRLQALEQVVESNSQSIFTYLQGGKQYVPPSAEQLVPISSVDGSNNNGKIEKQNGDQNKSSEPESTEEAVLDSSERQVNEKQWWNWRPW